MSKSQFAITAGFITFTCCRPCPEEARLLARRATQLSHEGDLTGAIDLIEKAIRLDQSGALDRYQGLRAEMYASMGRYGPERALLLYEFGCLLANRDLHDEAQSAYRAAEALDPAFLWPFNNLAWMLATNKNPAARSGVKALAFAEEACARSDWNCWAFLGTLAAAHAEAGNFEKAIKWQHLSLQIGPQEHRDQSERMLRTFLSGASYVDEGDPVAAGDPPDSDELGDISVEFLLKAVELLRRGRLDLNLLARELDLQSPLAAEQHAS